MIKIFETENKINFVDDKNSFVGYDTEQQCCENATWKIVDRLDKIKQETGTECNVSKCDLSDYYILTIPKVLIKQNKNDKHLDDDDDDDDDDGNKNDKYLDDDDDDNKHYQNDEYNAVVFLLKSKDKEKETLYLVLSNTHNGYYTHQVECNMDDNKTTSYYL
jgi:hypothetical protein